MSACLYRDKKKLYIYIMVSDARTRRAGRGSTVVWWWCLARGEDEAGGTAAQGVATDGQPVTECP